MTTDHSNFFSLRTDKGVHFEFLCTHEAERQKGKYNFTEKVKWHTHKLTAPTSVCKNRLTKTPRCRDMSGQIIPNYHNHFTKKGGNSNITYHKLVKYIFLITVCEKELVKHMWLKREKFSALRSVVCWIISNYTNLKKIQVSTILDSTHILPWFDASHTYSTVWVQLHTTRSTFASMWIHSGMHSKNDFRKTTHCTKWSTRQTVGHTRGESICSPLATQAHHWLGDSRLSVNC